MSRYIHRSVLQHLRSLPLDQGPKTSALRQTPTPQHPNEQWKMISVDFIVELPEAHGYDTVMVAVDSVGKRAHFIQTHTTITTQGAAELFLQNVWKLHGLPSNVVSDQGPQFVTEFTQELYRLLDIKISPSTAYHPQSYGQTKHLNQELEQYV
jgi:hypothetical protein